MNRTTAEISVTGVGFLLAALLSACAADMPKPSRALADSYVLGCFDATSDCLFDISAASHQAGRFNPDTFSVKSECGKSIVFFNESSTNSGVHYRYRCSYSETYGFYDVFIPRHASRDGRNYLIRYFYVSKRDYGASTPYVTAPIETWE